MIHTLTTILARLRTVLARDHIQTDLILFAVDIVAIASRRRRRAIIGNFVLCSAVFQRVSFASVSFDGPNWDERFHLTVYTHTIELIHTNVIHIVLSASAMCHCKMLPRSNGRTSRGIVVIVNGATYNKSGALLLHISAARLLLHTLHCALPQTRCPSLTCLAFNLALLTWLPDNSPRRLFGLIASSERLAIGASGSIHIDGSEISATRFNSFAAGWPVKQSAGHDFQLEPKI